MTESEFITVLRCVALWPGTPYWPPHILFPLRCCALCKRMCHLVPQAEFGESLFGTLINVQLSWVFLDTPSTTCPCRVLCLCRTMSRCVCRSREKRDGQTDGQTKEHTQCRCETYPHASRQAGLTRFEGVVDWAGDPSLPCEQGAAEAHVVRRVSDAELGQQQLPGRPLHQESVRPSVLRRPTPSFSRPRRQWQPL